MIRENSHFQFIISSLFFFIVKMKSKVTGDGIIVVYSITDRQSFQTSIQFMKNIRDHEMAEESNGSKVLMPVILVGNKSDLVRKRSVTKESSSKTFFFLIEIVKLSSSSLTDDEHLRISIS